MFEFGEQRGGGASFPDSSPSYCAERQEPAQVLGFAELPCIRHRLLDPVHEAGSEKLAAAGQHSNISRAQVDLAHPVLSGNMAKGRRHEGPGLFDQA